MRRAVSLVLVLGFVAGALLLAGCPMEDDDLPPLVSLGSDSPLIGTWEFTGSYGTDAYKIAVDTIQYGSGADDAFVSKFEAKIHGVQYFTDEKNSGMLYIEYTTKKPQYFSGTYGPAPDYAYTQTGGPFDPPGNFVVVMFHDLNMTNKTIKLANPYSASDTNPAKGDDETDVEFIASEVPTLAAAREKFNIDTENNFLYAGWSGVTAQTKVDS
ncbi:MAG: hypothetical protein LBG22_07330 [Treponema sp.]|nr:hypothetical protein [Treponema sp.]